MFYLGKITHVYKTTTKEKQEKSISAVKEMEKCALDDPTKFDYNLFAQNEYQILAPREEEALFWVKQAALQSGKNHVLLIFGGGHHFEWYKDKLSREGIEIQESIDTTLPDRFSLDAFYLEKNSTNNFYSSLGTHASSFLLFDRNESSLNFDFGDSKLMPNSSNRKYF